MKIKHAINDVQSMSHDGGKILKSLQNNSLPLIDIVVRESIQNSLDASIEGVENAHVDFKIDKFESEKLAVIFEEIDQKLIKKYPSYQEYLAITDTNTYGLTGDYTSDDIKVLSDSNFYKLVFGIGKNQSKDGAGGSWGYGKTSYFRLGVGIVIYYTRIKNGDEYEERLIASIIEDPSKEERLLSNNERGIAWWGEFSPDKKKIYPITDSQEISNILSIFGLKNYSDTQTGTTIIIPYLNKLNQDSIDEEALVFPWEKTYEDTILMAAQRWYFPRIWNNHYQEYLGNTFLECRVNKTLIHPALEFEPVFKIYQELYTSALLGKPTESNIKVEAIHLQRNALKNPKEEVGYVAFREISHAELKMTPPDNKPSGLAYLGIKDESLIKHDAPRVIAYARKPGMVIEYSVNELWSNTPLPLKENHILLGFFVPNSKATLNASFQENKLTTLESYLRSIEKSDHAKWEDDANVTIVKRIRDRTNQIIANSYQDTKEGEHSSATSALSRKFGALLLPPKKFGKAARSGSKPKNNGEDSESKFRGSDVTVIRSIPKTETVVEVEFKSFIKKESKNHLLLQVLTQDQRMDIHAWEKVMGDVIPFPFVISGVYIQTINNQRIDTPYENYSEKDIEFKLNSTTFDINSSLEQESVIEGKLILNVHSNDYIPNIAIRTL